jgi:hypothetical protein
MGKFDLDCWLIGHSRCAQVAMDWRCRQKAKGRKTKREKKVGGKLGLRGDLD